MKKRNEDKRILKTKRSLHSALAELLTEIPFNEITVNNICDRAKVHRATFYNYYHCKEELFDSMIAYFQDKYLFSLNVKNGQSYETIIDLFIVSFTHSLDVICNYLSKVLKVQQKSNIKEIINKMYYRNIYQALSLFPNEVKLIQKDFASSFYSGIFTNLIFWKIDNKFIDDEEIIKYLNFCLNKR